MAIILKRFRNNTNNATYRNLSPIFEQKRNMVTKSPLRFPEVRQSLPAGQYVTDEDMMYIVDCIREAIVE